MTVAYHEATWMSHQYSTDSDPAAREIARPDQTKWWPVGAYFYNQRRAQGCVLAPTPFGIILSIMFKQANVDQDDEDGVDGIAWTAVSSFDCAFNPTT